MPSTQHPSPGNPDKPDRKDQPSFKQASHSNSSSSLEALMRQAEEVGNFGSYEADLTSLQFRFSDGMFRLFGHTPGGFTPTLEYIDSVSHPDDIEAVRNVLEWAAQNKQDYVYRRRIYLPSGEMPIWKAKVRLYVMRRETP